MNQFKFFEYTILSSVLLFLIFFLGCNKEKENNDFLNRTSTLQKPKITTIIDLDQITKIDTINMEMIWNNNPESSFSPKNKPSDKNQIIRQIYCFQEGPDSSILILDKNSRIMKLSKDGIWLGEIGEMGSGPGEFIDPQYMCYANDKIFVADATNGRIEILDSKGNYLREIDRMDIGNLRFQFAVGPNDEIIGRTKNGESDLLIVLDSVGNIIRKFGNYIPYGFNYYQQIHFNNMYIFYDKKTENVFCVYENIPLIRRYNIYGEFLEEVRIEGNEELKNYKKACELTLKKNKETAVKNKSAASSNPFIGMSSIGGSKIILSSFYKNISCNFIFDVAEKVTKLEKVTYYTINKNEEADIPHNSIYLKNSLCAYSTNNSLFKQKQKEQK